MKILRVSFAGHRDIDCFSQVEEKLTNIITYLMNSYEFIEFYVGDNGDFDILATSVIRHLQKALDYNNSAINLVLP